MKSAKGTVYFWVFLSIVLFIGIAVQTLRVRGRDYTYYYQEKTARQGAVKKAREKKKTVSFTQSRYDVTRSLWFEGQDGVRKQFHLQAPLATFDLTMKPKEIYPQETFLRPHGWIQEKIGWEGSVSEEEVEQRNDAWRYVKTKKPLDETESAIPFQVIRCYDAMKAVWNIHKNTLSLFGVHFTDYKKPSHETTSDLSQAKLLMKGYADEMTWQLQENSKEVSSQGLQVHFENG